MKEYVYKFRAECLYDIAEVMKRISVRIKIEKPSKLPDCIAEITTDFTIEDIKKMMREIPDSHVMLETIAPISKYTGNRGDV